MMLAIAAFVSDRLPAAIAPPHDGITLGLAIRLDEEIPHRVTTA